MQDVLDSIENDTPLKAGGKSFLKIGADVLPALPKDTTDRNRTSPFAFTGNKFEFRALGSSESISCANIMLNTAVAEELSQFASELEGASDFNAALHELIKRTIKEHKRIIFNGNGYDESWVKEAESRGLLNLKSTPEALPYYVADKNKKLFTSHGIYTETEINARYEIAQEHYSKVVNIEALTTLDMLKKDYLPAISSYSKSVLDTYVAKKAAGIPADYECAIATTLSKGLSEAYAVVGELESALASTNAIAEAPKMSLAFRMKVIPIMDKARAIIDGLEPLVEASAWPVPSYGELLFGVR